MRYFCFYRPVIFHACDRQLRIFTRIINYSNGMQHIPIEVGETLGKIFV